MHLLDIMNKIIIFGLSLFSLKTISQTKTIQALVTSNSILKSKIGNKLYQYFSVSEGSYYTFEDNKHQRTGKFLGKQRLPKSFTTLNFLYHFNYPIIKGVKGGLWLIVDKSFNLIDSLSFDFIPQFLTKNKLLNFISVDTALAIAKANFIHKGLEIPIPELSYNDKLRKYTYTVSNKLTKILNQAGKECGEMEIVEIDAVTGKVEHIYKGYYGLIIR